MNKPNNFSNDKPTQKNHYSIRKFTVGTASIIVGSFLFFGQAHAEEGTEGNTWQREAVGTVNTAGQPSTTSQDKIIKLVQVLLLLHKQVKMELKQTLPTTKVKALQKLQELKLIKPMLHKQTLVQILPDKITKLLVLHKELKLLAQVKLRQLQLLEILKLNLMLKQQIKVMELL